MSILITGIDIPRHGMVINIYSDGRVANHFDECLKTIATAVPVPPHGDLIDRDEQIERAWRLNLSTRELIEEMLKSAPTIIPASEEEE